MDSLNDLPQRHTTHDTQTAAENAFGSAIESNPCFLIQSKDRKDYGTDYQLEVRHGSSMTNLRVHVQVKGTRQAANAKGTVRVAVERTNLNYLLNEPLSIYVCYHLPTRRLLVRHVSDVYREYEHRGPSWRQQETITISLFENLESEFQERLRDLALASGKDARDWRLRWTASPPTHLPTGIYGVPPPIELPNDPPRVQEILNHLYETGEDLLISRAFDQFRAVLGSTPGAMDLAYMAEINLGTNDVPFDSGRVREGIEALEDAIQRGHMHQGTLLYSQGNGWLALREYERARDTYLLALPELDGPGLQKYAAQCSKNMGSALEALGKLDAARAFYERALELDPDLGEAHFALALWYRHHGSDPAKAMEHLDCVSRRIGSSIEFSRVRAWRMECLFQLGDTTNAFREVWALLEHADRIEWIWPWCARQVATFGGHSASTSNQMDRFWRTYLEVHPDDIHGRLQRLLFLWRLRLEDMAPGIDFEEFKDAMLELINSGKLDTAFLWDRVGHWAQHDGNWEEAASAYRHAHDLQPEKYGYCLGTAFNFLDRHDEALLILSEIVENGESDAMRWFQVGVAKSGVGDFEGGIGAYRKALELDEDYDLAWFNLGGAYWNVSELEQAALTWSEAIRRFPEHPNVERVREFMPLLPELSSQSKG